MGKSVWILDKAYEDGEMRALLQELQDLGCDAERVEWDTLYPKVVNSRLNHSQLPAVALVNARIFTKHNKGDMALLYDWLESLQRAGIRLVNTVESLRLSHNKVVQASLLSHAGVPVPPTALAESPGDVQQCMEEWGDIVVKPVMGHSSVDVVKFLPKDYAASGPPGTPFGIREDIVLWHWFNRHKALCVQKFIDNPGRDIRTIVINGTVASCTYNISTAPDGSVRSLLHMARREPAPLTSRLEQICLNAASVLGVEICCIDLVEGPDGPVLIEVNPALSRWQPIEGTQADLTSAGISRLQAEFLASLAP